VSSDHLVVVTGGSAGLGRSLLTTAPHGAHLVDVSRSGPGEDPALAAVHHVAADLADPASWPQVEAAVRDRLGERPWGRVTVLHAAGTLDPIGFAGEVDTEAYTRNVLLNSAAGQVLGHRLLAALRALPGARRELVQLSSGAARTAYPGWSSYGAAKAALDHWVRAVGAEQRERGGVRVLAVAPGVIATAMQARIRATEPHDFPPVARFHRLHDEGELEDPDDVARRLWRLLDADEPASGAVVDLRDLADAEVER
jgi:benzil reductase ((S)-benzoin forming)